MVRIPETELERLKHEISIAALVEARGVMLRQQGADLVGCCPFHQDDTPSLHLSVEKNLWHCFGACAQGGSVLDWVMKAEGISFRHAVEVLRAKGATSLTAGTVVHRSRAVKLPPLAWDADDRALLRQVIDYYHATLKDSPEALAYLQSRGLTHPEMVDHFKLGYANRTLGYRLPGLQWKAGAAIRGQLQTLGLLRASGHEHFAGSLVIPVLDAHGQVTEVYGRKIRDDLRPGTPTHLYLPGPHQGVWNLDAFVASKTIILCEALLDALTFWCAGYRHVTASYGVDGFTADHLAMMKAHGTERVWIAYDRDEAGDRAADALAAQLMADGIGCWRVEFPKGMDANAYALKVQPAEKSLGLLLETARWVGPGPKPIVAVEPMLVSLPSPALAEDAATARPSPPATASPSVALRPTAPASAPPAAPSSALDEMILTYGPRRYRVRGLAKNVTVDALRVNLLVSCGDRVHVDQLDLYAARQRLAFVKQAAVELAVSDDVLKRDLGQVLLDLEARQEQHLRDVLQPKSAVAALTAAEQEAALALLRDPQLLDRILADFDRCGLVGEETNKLVGYLALVSRKLEEPLALLIQSSSAAGKSSLMDALLAFVPDEEKMQYSAMTGQALFYMGTTDLKHKVLAIVEDEGAARATYALKLLQSEGALTIAATGKDPDTGKLTTHDYTVEGPVMLCLTTTALEIGEELQNRCLVLTVNEDREQTRAIHRRQREAQTLDGLLVRQDRRELVARHQHAQQLLRPLLVANPFARDLTFLDTRTRTRRDHLKYLTLIRSVALLHQYQRPIHTIERHGRLLEYIEVTLADITIANRLAHEILGRSLDELAPQTRRLLEALHTMVTEACARDRVARADYRFSRKTVRTATGWSDTALRLHLKRLEELEYLLAHHGKRGQTFVYELLYDGQGSEGQPFVPGLLDVTTLRHTYDTKNAGDLTEFAGAMHPQRRPNAGGSRGPSVNASPHQERQNDVLTDAITSTHVNGVVLADLSYAGQGRA